MVLINHDCKTNMVKHQLPKHHALASQKPKELSYFISVCNVRREGFCDNECLK